MSTLKIVSEDEESGMDEAYQVLNVSIRRQIYSKFFAVWLQSVFLIASVALLALSLLSTGYTQWELIVSNTLMISLLSACYVSLGIFSNSLFKNFILAGVFHLVLILLFFSFSFIDDVMPFHIMGKNIFLPKFKPAFLTSCSRRFLHDSIIYFSSFIFIILYFFSSLILKRRRSK